MYKWLFPATLLWLVTSISSAGVYHDSNLDWRTIETEHFYIHYHQGGAELAARFSNTAEQIYAEISKFLNWHPKDRTDIVLTDEYDVSNGYASVFPRNTIVLLIAAPDSINSLEDHNGWLELVFRHEYLHIAHLDKVKGLPSGFQKVFGRHPFLFPNAYQPRWLIEGIATYVETDIEQGIGRGQSSYFDMLMRLEAQDGIKDVRRVNQPIGSWPAGHIPYLYGVHFFNFVHDNYGESKITQLVEDYSDNLIPFRINSNSNYVLRNDIEGLWAEFNEYLQKKYNKQIESLSQSGLREGNAITGDGYQASSLTVSGDKIYFVAFNGKTHPVLKTADANGAIVDVVNVNPGARIDLHPERGILVTQPETCRNARLYYDIYRLEKDGSHFTRLTNCARYRQAVWTDGGKEILAIHNDFGNNALHLLDSNGKLIKVLWQGTHNEQIGQINWSEKAGKLVASIWQKDKSWNLAIFDFQASTWILLHNDKHIQSTPVFSNDGQNVLYSSDEDGIYNIYKLNLSNGEKVRLTNVLGGAFNPGMLGDKLVYIGYKKPGFDIYVIDEPEEDKKIKLVLAPSDRNKPEEIHSNAVNNSGMLMFEVSASDEAAAKNNKPVSESSPYSALSSLAPTWWTPRLLVENQRTEVGLTTSGRDALSRHSYDLSYAYDFENEASIGAVNYFYDGLYPIIHLGYARSTDIFLDASDNPIRLRVEDDYILQTIFPFMSYDANVFFHAALLKEKHSDIWTNGVAPLVDTHEDLAGIALRYISTHRYPLSISRSEGRDLRLIYEDTDAFGDSDNKGQVTVGEWREFIHFGSSEHVFALRLVEAHGRNNSTPFRLGGIQDDDTLLSALMNGERTQLFNKRDYSLRGYDEGHTELVGQNMRLFSAEYRFPVWRIEHGWMAPPFGFNQVYGTLFYDVGGTWNTGSKPADYYAGAGFEINSDLDIFYNLRLNVALGFATGLDDVIGADKAYLRIGSHF